MQRIGKIAGMVALWLFVAGFVFFFQKRATQHRASTPVRSMTISIADSLRDEMLVSTDAVERWVASSKIPIVGVMMSELNLSGIEQAIRNNGFVDRASAYLTYNGELRIEVSQRRPLLRLRVDGYDCYATEEGFVFPSPKMASVYVPVVTGSYRPPVPKNYVGNVKDYIESLKRESNERIAQMQLEKKPLFEMRDTIAARDRAERKRRISKGIFETHDHFDERVAELRAEKTRNRRHLRYLDRENDKKIDAVTARQEAEYEKQKKLQKRYEDFLKLINFVKYIEEDSFWSAEIVQIIASEMSSGDIELELVPRTGRHTVLFGEISRVEEKLDNLLTFYSKALNRIGWDEFRTISVKYQGQVVCTKF